MFEKVGALGCAIEFLFCIEFRRFSFAIGQSDLHYFSGSKHEDVFPILIELDLGRKVRTSP